MFTKARTEFFNKYLFSFLIAASLAVHGILIFLSPQANQILSLSSLRERFIREPSEYAVALELEDADTQIGNEILDKKQVEDELEKEKKKEPEKKKEKLFTDTSDNAEDEETKVDTDKIGEKGAVAKDNFPNDKQPINNEPHAEGHSKAPLLGKGHVTVPGDGRQQPQEQQVTAQAFIPEESSGENNSPPRYANLPQGLEKQAETVKSTQKPQPQTPFEKKGQALPVPEESEVKAAEVKTVKLDETIKVESDVQPPKRERLTVGRGIRQEEAVEPLPERDGVMFADKQDEANKESEIKEDLLSSSLKESETVKEKDIKKEELAGTEESKDKQNKQSKKETAEAIPETPAPSSEMPGFEPQRRLDRGLDKQESPGEIKKPKVSFNVNAKAEGTDKEPVLFEDTISNAAVSGAPSFNVKEHEYGSYFKHIRDRISLYWFLGYGTRAEIKLETKDDKPIIIEFKVLPDGSIDGVKVVDDAGNFNLASRLISSVKNASPLNPFPSNIKEPSIEVRFNFYFF